MVQLIKVRYLWIRVSTDWKDIIKVMKEYRPKLHYQAVTWRKPNIGTSKCNSDGASKGNPGESAYGFCLRDDQGDVVYAEAEGIRVKTNTEAETIAILKALRYCKRNNFNRYILETDSLSIAKMVNREWKIPWQQAEEIQEIQELVIAIKAHINHVFREANQLADQLANEACKPGKKIQAQTFQQLSIVCIGIVNTDKTEMPSLRIRTRKIPIQAT